MRRLSPAAGCCSYPSSSRPASWYPAPPSQHGYVRGRGQTRGGPPRGPAVPAPPHHRHQAAGRRPSHNKWSSGSTWCWRSVRPPVRAAPPPPHSGRSSPGPLTASGACGLVEADSRRRGAPAGAQSIHSSTLHSTVIVQGKPTSPPVTGTYTSTTCEAC